MVHRLLWIMLISTAVMAQSLYTDTPLPLPSPPAPPVQSPSIAISNTPSSNGITRYTTIVFRLSQSTRDMDTIVNESIVFSDVKRLQTILKELSTLLPTPSAVPNVTASSTTALPQLYSDVVFGLYAITPYINALFAEKPQQTTYYVDYLDTIGNQLLANLERHTATLDQLNVGQTSTFPFTPRSPQELSFAVETQLQQSVMSMFNDANTSSTNTPMPYSFLSTPSETTLFNGSGLFNGNGDMNAAGTSGSDANFNALIQSMNAQFPTSLF
jgi:hypothetical protein